MDAIQISHLKKYYSDIKAVDDISFSVKKGDLFGLLGVNGAGKSTLLNAIAGVFLVDEGSISIDDVDVTRMSEHRRASFLGRVFQDPMMGTAATMGLSLIHI